MDHNQAIENQAVERYLLGELKPDERESFEEHYFDCAVCAGEVREAARFRANAREVLRRGGQFEEEKAGWRGWFSWPSLIPAAVSVVLLGIVGYQNLVTFPALLEPAPLYEPVTLDGATRASLPQVLEGKPLDLAMPSPGAGQVIPVLTTEGGRELTRGKPMKCVPDEPFRVYFPGKYSPGRYVVVLREAGTDRELAQNKFDIVAKETNTNER